MWVVKFAILWRFILLKQEQQKASTGEKPFRCEIWSKLWKKCHIWKASLLYVDASLPPVGYVCVRGLIITLPDIKRACIRICNSWRFSLWFKLKTVSFLYIWNDINWLMQKNINCSFFFVEEVTQTSLIISWLWLLHNPIFFLVHKFFILMFNCTLHYPFKTAVII